MKIYVVIGGNFYEGHEVSTLALFPNTKDGKYEAEKYSRYLQDGTLGNYDRVFFHLIEVSEFNPSLYGLKEITND